MNDCQHGARPGECEDEGCLYRREVKNELLGLAGRMAAQSDQAQAMNDAELGALLVSGRFTTTETHEAGRRLILHYNGTQTGTSVAPAFDYPKHVGIKPEDDQKCPCGKPAGHRKMGF